MLQFKHFLCVKIFSKNLSGDFLDSFSKVVEDVSLLGNSNYLKGHKKSAAVSYPRSFISEHLRCALLQKLNSIILED